MTNEWAWLAGFIDGEGCFYFQKRLSHGERTVPVARLSITQVIRDPLVEALRLIGSGGIYRAAKATSTTQESSRLDVTSHLALMRAIETMIPMFKVKRRQAMILHSVACGRAERVARAGANKLVPNTRRELFLIDAVGYLNHRGADGDGRLLRMEKSHGMRLGDTIAEIEAEFKPYEPVIKFDPSDEDLARIIFGET